MFNRLIKYPISGYGPEARSSHGTATIAAFSRAVAECFPETGA